MMIIEAAGRESVIERISRLPTFSGELGLDLTRSDDRFRWLVAVVLFARPISSGVAIRTWQEFERQGLLTPGAIIDAGWDRLVEALDAGGYVRYDFSTATNLLEIIRTLCRDYGGDLEEIHRRASDSADLERRLDEFRGIGPVAVNIFLRELRGIWPRAAPRPSDLSVSVACRIGLDPDGLEVPGVEPVLVKIALEFCRRRRCPACPLGDLCQDPDG